MDPTTRDPFSTLFFSFLRVSIVRSKKNDMDLELAREVIYLRFNSALHLSERTDVAQDLKIRTPKAP